MPESQSNLKKYYSLFLAIAFIGIGGWKLYEKWILDLEMDAYKWILGAGLFVLGWYQLIQFFKPK